MKLKRILSIALAAMLVAMTAVSLSSCGNKKDGDFEYREVEKYVTSEDAMVTYYEVKVINTELTEVELPTEYDGVPVKGLMSSAFEDCTKLEKITIPSTYIELQSSSFSELTSLKELVYRCVSAVDIKCKTSPFEIEGSEGITVTIGKEVTEIPDNLFATSTVKKVVFEEGSQCKVIRRNAFNGSDIKEIVFPESLGSWEYSISGCKSLESITFLGEAFIFLDYFDGCTSLKNVKYMGTTEKWLDDSKQSKLSTDITMTVDCLDGELQYIKGELAE